MTLKRYSLVDVSEIVDVVEASRRGPELTIIYSEAKARAAIRALVALVQS